MVLVGAIAGPTTPYVVQWKNPSIADTGPWPTIGHSCVGSDTSTGDPAVRIGKWVNEFGAAGQMLSVCSDNFAPILQTLAERLSQRLPPPVNVP